MTDWKMKNMPAYTCTLFRVVFQHVWIICILSTGNRLRYRFAKQKKINYPAHTFIWGPSYSMPEKFEFSGWKGIKCFPSTIRRWYYRFVKELRLITHTFICFSYTLPEKFVFSGWQGIKCFPSIIRQSLLNPQQSPVILVCVSGNSHDHDNRDIIDFEKLRFNFFFSPHPNTTDMALDTWYGLLFSWIWGWIMFFFNTQNFKYNHVF